MKSNIILAMDYIISLHNGFTNIPVKVDEYHITLNGQVIHSSWYLTKESPIYLPFILYGFTTGITR